MNSRVELQWRLAAVLLIAVVLLGILAVTTRAQGAWVHGLIDADNRAGYKVRLERWVGVWEQRGWSRTNISGAWGIGAPMAGRYRARLEEMPAGAKMVGARYPGGINGQMSLANRSVEFNVPAAGLVGDIVFIIASAPTATLIVPTIVPTITPFVQLTATPWPTLPVPTTLYPPTVDPTATATATPRPTATANPAISYIEISPHIQGTLMAYTDLMLQEFTPASCFEIAAAEKGCPLAVTQSWVAQVDGECWKFRPFSCPGSDGIELAARCAAPCEVAVIEDGYW